MYKPQEKNVIVACLRSIKYIVFANVLSIYINFVFKYRIELESFTCTLELAKSEDVLSKLVVDSLFPKNLIV